MVKSARSKSKKTLNGTSAPRTGKPQKMVSKKPRVSAKAPAKAAAKIATKKPPLVTKKALAKSAGAGANGSRPANKGKNGSPKGAAVKANGAKSKHRRELSQIVLTEGYRPSDDEPFMNARQRAYFRKKLLAWKEEIVKLNRETLHGLHAESGQHADLADRATSETDRALELRARDRQRKLIAKIDAALARIDSGSYGYCEETGEPISLKRLDARPIATLSIEAQERHERRERVFRDD